MRGTGDRVDRKKLCGYRGGGKKKGPAADGLVILAADDSARLRLAAHGFGSMLNGDWLPRAHATPDQSWRGIARVARVEQPFAPDPRKPGGGGQG